MKRIITWRHVEFKYRQNIWVEMTNKEFETMKFEFKRKVNAKFKILRVK